MKVLKVIFAILFLLVSYNSAMSNDATIQSCGSNHIGETPINPCPDSEDIDEK